ncbi:MAG: hypothetical protein ROO76_05490 [Terriglobia bacterium]|nr:hypothetical protein [Terriglobia bacterium]
MRRSTAISQVLLLLAFYAVPLLASSNVALPACCRRSGAHHCAIMGSADGQNTGVAQTAFHNPVYCPFRFPTSILTHTIKLFMAPASAAGNQFLPQQPAVANDSGSALSQSATALDNRGPPAFAL